MEARLFPEHLCCDAEQWPPTGWWKCGSVMLEDVGSLMKNTTPGRLQFFEPRFDSFVALCVKNARSNDAGISVEAHDTKRIVDNFQKKREHRKDNAGNLPSLFGKWFRMSTL